MAPLDDILIKRRRGRLGASEQRRLDSARRASPEYDLVLLAHEVFDRDGRPAPGDAERLRELVDAVGSAPPRAADALRGRGRCERRRALSGRARCASCGVSAAARRSARATARRRARPRTSAPARHACGTPRAGAAGLARAATLGTRHAVIVA
jgi:hypothetical protein